MWPDHGRRTLRYNISDTIYGVIFVMTVLAYAIVPVLEEKARDAGTIPPPSPFRDALRNDGWRWVLGEVAALIVLGLASMGLDRYRRWQRERGEGNAAGGEPGDEHGER
jgi:hypothetical protein